MKKRRPANAWSNAPSLDELAAIAETAFASIPETFRREVEGVAIRVADFPDEETEREMNLESPFELLGLYRGVSIDQKSTLSTPQDVDQIFLYRRPILDYWAECGDALEDIIRHVLVHELGHHFGFSDADMEAIEDEA
ncbi:MAG: metallopeptidase family protein [Alphaproteobacteria bacterium]|nr:metallopeptidase family protein [Alphaproteobacteria bacterium]